MAAVLLKLPNIIRSEQYQYINPHSHIAYIDHVQKQEQTEKILDSLIEEANDRRDASLALDQNQNDDPVDDCEECESQCHGNDDNIQ